MMGSYIEICRPSAVATSCFHDHSVINVVQLEVHSQNLQHVGIRFEREYFACAHSYLRKPQGIIANIGTNISNNRSFGRRPLLTNARSSKWSVSVSQNPRTL